MNYHYFVISGFETYTCENCSEEFTAHPIARAAFDPYCTPSCESVGKSLA